MLKVTCSGFVPTGWILSFLGCGFFSSKVDKSSFVCARALLAALATGEPKEICDALFSRADVTGGRDGSGVMLRGSFDKFFWDGDPTRETLTLRPGGMLGAGEVGFDRLNWSWKTAEAGCDWGKGSPGGSDGVPTRPADSLGIWIWDFKKPKVSTGCISVNLFSSGERASFTVDLQVSYLVQVRFTNQ